MQKTLDLLSKIKCKYPKFNDKIENIIFILESLRYRLNKIELEDRDLKASLDAYIQSRMNEMADPIELCKRRGIPESNFSSTAKKYRLTEKGKIDLPKPLFFEFNSFVVSIITLVDNIVDLYISIQYQPHPTEHHWDLGDFKKGRHKILKLDFSADPMQKNIAESTWLNNTIGVRDRIVHRIAPKQILDFSFEVEFWAKELGFPIKRDFKIKEIGDLDCNLFRLSNETMKRVLVLSDNFIEICV